MRPIFILMLFIGLGVFSSAHAQWEDVDNVTFDYAKRANYDKVKRELFSVVTITNVGDEDINGPLRLMIDASSHIVLNLTESIDGVAVINIYEAGLASGDSKSITLRMEIKRALLAFDLRLQAKQETQGTGLSLADNQIALFYSREDGIYDDWGLHLWNGEGCGSYDSPTTDSVHFNNWPNPYPADGIHPVYGAYYILHIQPGAACYNFIIHKGDEKALGNENGRFEVAKGQEAFTFHGYPEIWYEPLSARPLMVDGARAHWINPTTFLWLSDTSQAQSFELYHSADAELRLANQASFDSENAIALSITSMSDAQRAQLPHLDSFTAFSASLSEEQAKQLVKQQLLAVARDSNGDIVDITRVQIPRVLDALYTEGTDDADEAKLGAVYEGSQVSAFLWAPTARQVKLHIFDDAKTLITTHLMTQDSASGIWTYSDAKANLDRKFYQYELELYHPLTEDIETLVTTDPYSISLSTNGRHSQFVDIADLQSADLVPQGWTARLRPSLEAPEDAVIYETHIRDFSAMDESVQAQHRGKYMAFTEAQSAPVRHLTKLAESGVSHIHLLPANDIATINEDTDQRVDLDDTVADLCAKRANAPVCGIEAPEAKLIDVLRAYEPSSADAQALVNSMRSLDGFNWGYDPHHFAAPEGSYATEPDGVARIKEMRAMVMALNNMGLQVILDVVYNHTASSGLFDNSVLDKTVPGYYHRLSEVTGQIENSTCCENTATEHRMMAKLMEDSLVSFAEHFGFDGFRFDLMGHIPKQAVLDAREAVRAVDADTLFYGEGWNFGEVVNDRRFPQASQFGMAGTEVGTFNDRLREAVRSAQLFTSGGSLHQQDLIRLSMAGSLSSYEFVTASGDYVSGGDYDWNGQSAAYARDPADSIHYISKHDNETLWDQLQYNLPAAMPLEDRVRIQGVASSIPLLSQGIPFIHMGVELLRSKSMDRNTYDAGDWFNKVDFNGIETAWNSGLPLAQDNQNNWSIISNISANPKSAIDSSAMLLANEQFNDFLAIRKSSPLFKLRSAEDIRRRITFHNTGESQIQGLIVMSLDDGIGVTDIDPAADAYLVVVNGTDSAQSFSMDGIEGIELHSIQQSSLDSALSQVSVIGNTVNVPRYTSAVFVKNQNGGQGIGISALPPYGEQAIYLRGAMNNWSTDDAFSYQGNSEYALELALTQGNYEFKIADEFYSQANIGGGFEVPLQSEVTLSNYGNNLSISIPQDAQYVFTLNAENAANPSLIVSSDSLDPPVDVAPYPAPIYVRGSMNAWGTPDEYQMQYEGNNIYSVTLPLSADTHEFKVADSDWSSANIGGFTSNQVIELNTDWGVSNSGGSQNLRVITPEQGQYIFRLDANDAGSPNLRISPQSD